MQQLNKLKAALQAQANPEKARILARFFKTGVGEYGEGDQFLGITVPKQREIAKQFVALALNDIGQLLQSPFHEERLTSLLILVAKYPKKPEEIYNFYIQQFDKINNWDLVDLTASKIVGAHLFNNDRSIIKNWAKSEHLWTRRIAIVATHYFIRQNQFYDTLKVSKILINDSHDLIHKAVGWMLREVGKRDQNAEETFLKKHYQHMPRTMLRYAIERFPEDLRQQYLKGTI
ncbi:MAG: DNA alkylation repair protein [Gammaproteobacteria bacterium]|nr:DNA alkylation repair protein [Gammaproteobacteria bacterium]